MPSSSSNIPDTKKEQSSWSSFFTVDPSKILPILIQKGGLVMPSYIEQDLKKLEKLCHCDESKLSIVNRQLVLRNLTVSLPVNESNNSSDHELGNPSLRIGRIMITWDSYLQPCVDIQVEDIDVLVEFDNLLLTKTNWHKLKAAGFPPDLLLMANDNEEYEEDATSSFANSFVRVGRLDMLGNVKIKVNSSPLNKTITPDIVLNLNMMEELSGTIRQRASISSHGNERLGCTTDELYIIIEDFFKDKLRKAIQKTVSDIAHSRIDPERQSLTVQEARKFLSGAKDVFSDYGQAVRVSMEDRIDGKIIKLGEVVEEKVAQRLDKVEKKFGNKLRNIVGPANVDKLISLSRDKVDSLMAEQQDRLSVKSVIKGLSNSRLTEKAMDILADPGNDEDKTLHKDIYFPDSDEL